MQVSMIIIFFTFIIGLAVGFLADLMSEYFLENIESDHGDSGKHLHGNFLKDLFLLLKGRWGSFGAKARVRCLLMGLLNGSLYITVFMANGWNIQSILYCLMTSAFLVISVVDECSFEIPLPCNLYIGGVGIIACIVDYKNLVDHILGFLLIGVALYLLYFLSKGGAIGGGDVKLMAAIGLVIGWKKVILAFLLGCIIGSACHVLRIKFSKADRVLAMGPYLCIGSYLCALWGDAMIVWYLSLLVR